MNRLSQGISNFQNTRSYNESIKGQIAESAGIKRPSFGYDPSNLGFRGGINHSFSRTASVRMMASASNEISEDNDSSKDSTDAVTTKSGIKFGAYSWFVLSVLLGIRVLY